MATYRECHGKGSVSCPDCNGKGKKDHGSFISTGWRECKHRNGSDKQAATRPRVPTFFHWGYFERGSFMSLRNALTMFCVLLSIAGCTMTATGSDYTGSWVNEKNEIMTINEVANGQYKIEGFQSAEGFTKFATMDEKGNLVASNHWGDHTFIVDKKNNQIISNNAMKGTHYWKKQK